MSIEKYNYIKVFGRSEGSKIATVSVATDTGGTVSIQILVNGDPDDPGARWNDVITLIAGETKQIHTDNAIFRATPNGGAEYSWEDGR